jgi:hypothetical protein
MRSRRLNPTVAWNPARSRQLGLSLGLADLRNANHFHDGRFLLPLCKSIGLRMDRVGPGKPLTVIVKDGNLPMMVLSPPIFLEGCKFPIFHSEEYITLIHYPQI